MNNVLWNVLKSGDQDILYVSANGFKSLFQGIEPEDQFF